jgi:hypothetical protein
MQTLRDNYLNAYCSLKLTRYAEGVLVAQFIPMAGHHFHGAGSHRICGCFLPHRARSREQDRNPDRGRREFIPGIDFASFGNVVDPGVWSQVHDEGVQMVENITNILRISSLPCAVSKYHWPFCSTIGIAIGQSSLPATRVFAVGLP